MRTPITENIKEYYFSLIDQVITPTVKGYSSTTLHIWLINFNIIMFLIFFKVFDYLKNLSDILFYLAAWVFIYIFGFIPRSFFDDKARTTRRLRSKYPLVWKTLNKLVKKGTGEVLDNAFQCLIVNNRKYFLVMYRIRQKWWDSRIPIKFTGCALIDEDGILHESSELFSKTFLTLQYAFIGGIRTQGIEEAQVLQIKETYKVFIPRAVIFLHWQKRVFEDNGLLGILQQLFDKLHVVYQANEDVLTIFRTRAKMAKAMGYSFGYEYMYEDALRDEEISRTFSQYMTQTYLQEVRGIDELLIKLLKTIAVTEKWPVRKLTLWSIKTIHRGCKNVYRATQWYSRHGIPGKSEWELFVSRMDYAKELGMTVKSDRGFSHAYPYENCVYHDDFFKTWDTDLPTAHP